MAIASLITFSASTKILSADVNSNFTALNNGALANNAAGTITATATPQLTLAYDGTHTATLSVSAAGLLTVNATTTVTITPATTITGALTCSAAATVGTTLGVTGATTLSSTLAVAGLLTASAGLTVTGLIREGGTTNAWFQYSAPDTRVISLNAAGKVAFRDSGNVNDNMTISEAGAMVVRAGMTCTTLAMTGALTGVTTGAFSGAVSMAALTCTTITPSSYIKIAGSSPAANSSTIHTGSTGNLGGNVTINVAVGGAFYATANDVTVLAAAATGIDITPTGSGVITITNTQVVSSRKTGWTVMTGTPQRGTFATSTVTLAQLAGLVMALEQDLITHGLIGT